MNYTNTLKQVSPGVLFLLLIWSILWKGLALWRAVKFNQKNWFIIILVISSDLGILEIIYLFGFAKKKMTLSELKFWEKNPK